MNKLTDILECIAKFDKTENLETKGRYFETIQKDIEKYLQSNQSAKSAKEILDSKKEDYVCLLGMSEDAEKVILEAMHEFRQQDIELPSDKEIAKNLPYKNPKDRYQLGKNVGYILGIKWMREQVSKNKP